jgi:hypothetical protein
MAIIGLNWRLTTLAALQARGDKQVEAAFRRADADARAREDLEEEAAAGRSRRTRDKAANAAAGTGAAGVNNVGLSEAGDLSCSGSGSC